MLATYYETLEVSPRATPETIRAAFKSLMQRHHPDKHAADHAASRRARELLQAYAVLSDAGRRQAYDAACARERMQAAACATGSAGPGLPPAPASRRRNPWAAWACAIGIMGLGALYQARLTTLLSAIAGLLHSPLFQSGDWARLRPGGAAMVTGLLLAPALAMLLAKRRILLVLPLAFLLGFAGSPSLAAGCYDGSLKSCFGALDLNR